METTINELEKQLKEKIEALDEERRRNNEVLSREREEMIQIAAAERTKQLEEMRQAEERARKRRVAEQESERARAKKAREEQLALEQKQSAADELIRAQKERLEWLQGEIAKAEFMEEQHKKTMDDFRTQLKQGLSSSGTPESLPGDPVSGIEGTTPETPLMSQHLKTILRQAQRNY